MESNSRLSPGPAPPPVTAERRGGEDGEPLVKPAPSWPRALPPHGQPPSCLRAPEALRSHSAQFQSLRRVLPSTHPMALLLSSPFWRKNTILLPRNPSCLRNVVFQAFQELPSHVASCSLRRSQVLR